MGAVGWSFGVYISPELFSGGSAFCLGVRWVGAGRRGLWGAASLKLRWGLVGLDCVVVSVVGDVSQYFYRVDRGAAELLASRSVEVGLLVSFHVGLGCRLAVAVGLKRTAVAVDGNYTIRHLGGAGRGV